MAMTTHTDQKKYLFRLIRQDDLEWARVLHNDPDVLSMLKDPHEVTPDMQKAWYQLLRTSHTSKRVVVECNGERIGLIRLDDIDIQNHAIAVGLDIHRDHRGKGHATPLYAVILDYCFKACDMHRCWLDVAAYNTIARHVYGKLGFKEEGRARERIYRFNAYHDYILMGMLKHEYLNSSLLRDSIQHISYSINL